MEYSHFILFIGKINEFKKHFDNSNIIICYAVKANPNIAILKILSKLGCGAEVVSIGELLRTLKAGISNNKIVFSGVGKTSEELEYAIKKNILQINVESLDELRLIIKISKKVNQKNLKNAIRSDNTCNYTNKYHANKIRRLKSCNFVI